MPEETESQEILVADREAIIALGVADVLEGAGYQVAGPFSRSHEVLRWLERNTPRAVVIDPGPEPCPVLIGRLRERQVPVVVHSGVPPRPGGLAPGALWLEKPAPEQAILVALSDLGCEPDPPGFRP